MDGQKTGWRIDGNGQTLEDLATGTATIEWRDCQDVPNFIRRLQAAQEATRNHTIQFD